MQYCERINSKLAEYTSKSHQDEVEKVISFGNSNWYWIGLTDHVKQGNNNNCSYLFLIVQYRQSNLAAFLYCAKTPLQWRLRQKWMISSCSPWKIVTFFGKEHVNWPSNSGVMIGRSSKINFGKLKIGVLALKIYIVTKKIIDFYQLDFST